jgi:hypothetical protein
VVLNSESIEDIELQTIKILQKDESPEIFTEGIFLFIETRQCADQFVASSLANKISVVIIGFEFLS